MADDRKVVPFILMPDTLSELLSGMSEEEIGRVIVKIARDTMLEQNVVSHAEDFPVGIQRMAYTMLWNDNRRNFHNYIDKCKRFSEMGKNGGKKSGEVRSAKSVEAVQERGQCVQARIAEAKATPKAEKNAVVNLPDPLVDNIAKVDTGRVGEAGVRYTPEKIHVAVSRLFLPPAEAEKFEKYAYESHVCEKQDKPIGNLSAYLKICYMNWKRNGLDKPEELHRITRGEFDEVVKSINARGGKKIRRALADECWEWLALQDKTSRGEDITKFNASIMISNWVISKREEGGANAVETPLDEYDESFVEEYDVSWVEELKAFNWNYVDWRGKKKRRTYRPGRDEGKNLVEHVAMALAKIRAKESAMTEEDKQAVVLAEECEKLSGF